VPASVTDLEKSVHELTTLVGQFRFDEAFNKFYSQDIVSMENEDSSIVGLDAYREAGKKYLASISNQSAKLLSVIVSDGISVTEWRYTFDHKEWGHWDKVQVSVQRWKDGKIIHERHYYS
jgi:hypothetical protein